MFCPRPQHTWQLRRRTLDLGSRTVVMGVLNVTPDSFSDGGTWLRVEAAVAHAIEMFDQGAEIVDVGGESTRPGAQPVPAEEEQARVIPVLRGILRARPEAVLSVDTYRAQTARLALDAGAEIVNDVSGGLWDAAMTNLWANARCGVVLMHTRGAPDEWSTLPPLPQDEVVPLVRRELSARIDAALTAKVARDAIVIDPGFGFGKIMDDNFILLAQLQSFQELGFPLAAGLSRKGFLRRAIAKGAASAQGSAAEALRDATLAANVAAILQGAHLVRVHDVAAGRRAAAVADCILGAADGLE